ncbi:MAG: DUF1801 domain-containing protein [Devosiaceae bacterium]|nr:DUF1801 domain-containing protein [Devosiaceae bacterium MH13]
MGELRALIHEAAAEIDAIGPLAESIKWGQPSFTPARPNLGSSVRIEARQDGTHALMVICTTDLVEQFKELYADTLTFDGKRAIIVPAGPLRHRQALKHCIQLALTYKLRKRQAGLSV